MAVIGIEEADFPTMKEGGFLSTMGAVGSDKYIQVCRKKDNQILINNPSLGGPLHTSPLILDFDCVCLYLT